MSSSPKSKSTTIIGPAMKSKHLMPIEPVEPEVDQVSRQKDSDKTKNHCFSLSHRILSRRAQTDTHNSPTNTIKNWTKACLKHKKRAQRTITMTQRSHHSHLLGMMKMLAKVTSWDTNHSRTNQFGQVCSMHLRICSIWTTLKHPIRKKKIKHSCRRCQYSRRKQGIVYIEV